MDYALDKAKQFFEKATADMMDQLSTKIRPDRKHKTDTKDLDGGSIDAHALLEKLPRPKGGFTLGKYKYMGPYNPLKGQLEYDPETGKVLKWHDQPYNKVMKFQLTMISVMTE